MSEISESRLREVRQSLLRLHKTLLDCEQEAYERAHDRVENSYELLQLVMNDPWFAWLHSLSGLVVQIDEMLDAKEPLLEPAIEALINEARNLLRPSESGDEFQQKYFSTLQQCPDAVIAHAEAVKIIGRRRVEDENKSPQPTA
ncbi:MAG: hypothetical protein ABI967_02485 [bacterium]